MDVPERAYIDGILGVYELKRIDLLLDMLVWAYERSAARYAAVRSSLGEPDVFRLRYRTLIAETVAGVVRGVMDKITATAFIQQRAGEDVSPEDQGLFVEVAETEIMNLHDGNIARYRLRPSEYQSRKATWR